MTWSTAKGFGFRATSGYVTDATNDTYVLLATSYPTTRTVGGDSITFGWESAPDDERDRDTTDSRIAGMNFKNAGGSEDIFRVDLPAAGDYRIRLAVGDFNAPQGYFFDIRDTTTALLTLGSATSAQTRNFIDTVGGDYYPFLNPDWPTNNATADYTFGTTIFRYVMRPMTALLNCIAYIQLEQLSGSASRVNSLTGKLGFPMIGKL